MDDHLPSGSPPQQHLSIGLGIEPFTGLSGWLLGLLAGYQTLEIYTMIAILGKHGHNISSKCWRKCSFTCVVSNLIICGTTMEATIINLASKIVDFLQIVKYILVAIFNIKNFVTSDTFESVSLSLNYLLKRCLLNMKLLNAFQCIKIKTDGLGH